VTFNQVRLLLTSVLPKLVFDAERALELVAYNKQRNYAVYFAHRKRTLMKLATVAEQEVQKRLRYPGRLPKNYPAAAIL